MRLTLLIDVTADAEHVEALQARLAEQPAVEVVGLLPSAWPGLFVGAKPAGAVNEATTQGGAG